MKMCKVESAQGNQDYVFFCPGCKCGHFVRVTGKSPVWQWNGDIEKPTISPSILVHSHKTLAADDKTVINTPQCHSFVKDGNIQFLADCTHELANKTVPLEDF